MTYTRIGRGIVQFSLAICLATIGASAETVVSWIPLHFVVTNPPCLSVPATVTGDAEAHQVIRVTRNSDGTYRLDVNRVLQGTAVDTNGNSYQFHDVDHFVIDGSATAPDETPPFTLVGTGKIALISKGKAPNIKLLMFINWQINADGSVTDLGSLFEGDIGCDPSSEL